MKRAILPLLLLAMTCGAYAEIISDSLAAQIAAATYHRQTVSAGKKAPAKAIRFVKAAAPKFANLHIMNAEDGSGFVIVAADDVAHPILGSSDSGAFQADNMPDNLRWWLSEYERQIQWAISNGLTSSEDTRQEWSRLLAEQTTAAEVVVAPMLQTQWGQEAPYYDMTPTIAGQHCPTGCVATAAAQIMKYYEYPSVGFGTHSYSIGAKHYSADFGATHYDWANMLNNYYGESPSFLSSAAVATLMSHVGIACNMQYAKEGSGAYAWAPMVGLHDYFGYSDHMMFIDRNNYPSEDTWRALIQYQLDNGMPFILGGSDEQAENFHSFVCDGYKSDGSVHINWGWEGLMDGYFQLSALTPSQVGIGGGTSMNFSFDQSAIINIKPAIYDPLPRVHIDRGFDVKQDSIVQGNRANIYVTLCSTGSEPFDGKVYLALYNEYNHYLVDSTQSTFPLKPDMTYYRNYMYGTNDPISISPVLHGFIKSRGYNSYIWEPGVYTVSVLYRDSITGKLEFVEPDFELNAAQITVLPADSTYEMPDRQPTTYTISTIANNGTISGAGAYLFGEQVILYAQPDDGYKFVKWSDGSTSNPRRISVFGNETYEAVFQSLTTSVDDIKVSSPAQKFFRDGHLYILRGEQTFDATGRLVK